MQIIWTSSLYKLTIIYLYNANHQGYNCKIMPNILEYYLQISQTYGLIAVCTLLTKRITSVFCAISGKVIQSTLFFPQSGLIQSNYTLQNRGCAQKLFQYTQQVLKRPLRILKSPKKP